MSGKVQVSPQQEKRNRKTKCFALGHPPDPKQHFYIPSAADVEYIVKNMTKTSNQYLVRGPPACGKTTLAEALCRRYPYTKRGDDCSDDCEPSFVLIHGENLKEPITFIEELKTATHDDLDDYQFIMTGESVHNIYNLSTKTPWGRLSVPLWEDVVGQAVAPVE